MSLYDGLIDDKEGGVVGKEPKPELAGWGSSLKMLQIQKQLQAKSKASQLHPKRRGNTTLAPVIDLKRHNGPDETGPLHFNQQTGKLERRPGVPLGVGPSPFIASEPPTSLAGVTDEYDPMRPNEYESFVKKRKEHRQKERGEREREREEREESALLTSSSRSRRRERHRNRDEDDDDTEFERRRKRRAQEDEEKEQYDRPKRGTASGAAIAPPSSLIEEVVPDAAASSSPDRVGGDVSPPRASFGRGGSGGGGGVSNFAGSVASKIMAKYGYREGQGLGKKEQGMSTALQVEKTSKRGGKIIHERDIPKVEPSKVSATTADLLKNPSKVILLRNMVGPGEVDEDLEPETAEECSKYGKVIKCVIFEIPGGIEEEAVRIFLEFERLESAIKAVVDLNGRFFGGRIVQACFYNLDKFRRLDLVDEV